jgi:hypothetical protein
VISVSQERFGKVLRQRVVSVNWKPSGVVIGSVTLDDALQSSRSAIVVIDFVCGEVRLYPLTDIRRPSDRRAVVFVGKRIVWSAQVQQLATLAGIEDAVLPEKVSHRGLRSLLA